MQGNLQEIDIRSLLQLVALGQRTGELLVVSSTKVQSWFVFFDQGRVVYATGSKTGPRRLQDYLYYYRRRTEEGTKTFPAPEPGVSEYSYLWSLLGQGLLSPDQGRHLAAKMIHESLLDIIGLHSGDFVFQVSHALTPQIIQLDLLPLVSSLVHEAQEWKKFDPYIKSPDQHLLLRRSAALESSLSVPSFQFLAQAIRRKPSIRQLARQLGRDTTTVAKTLYPYISKQIIQATEDVSTHPAASQRNGNYGSLKKLRVVCVDDSHAICKVVECILEQKGYEVTGIASPLRALNLLFQLKPDLILCDIAMPELDGYQLCAMLRQSVQFRRTPIVMLTSHEGLLDRAQARIAGATDYLTKPFQELELVTLVKRYT